MKLINKLRYYYWVKVCARDMVKYSKKVLFTKVDKTSEGYYAYITKMGYHRKMMFHAKNLMTGEVSDSWSVCSFEEI